jgi:uncharacterized lipoprotein YehR (DUF1307 family)
MKKLHLILAIVFAVAITSCGKSKEEQAIDALKEMVK